MKQKAGATLKRDRIRRKYKYVDSTFILFLITIFQIIMVKIIVYMNIN